MDIQLAKSGDRRPHRRLLARVSDAPRSWPTASSRVPLGRQTPSGACRGSRDAQVRQNLALDYLERSNLALEEIASLLGYGDAASFNRAFGRWMGDTPGRYRMRRASRAVSSRRPRRRRSAK